jgi:hypothetical protein
VDPGATGDHVSVIFVLPSVSLPVRTWEAASVVIAGTAGLTANWTSMV